jgi:predicted lipoprotein with Yx(FWY)xxD motif
MRSRVRLLAIFAALSLVFAACGGDDDPSAGDVTGETAVTETGPTAATGPTATGGTGETAAGDATVTVADSSFGEIVADAEGNTLYVFLPDEGGASTCYDDCEAAWPPLTVDGTPAGDGVDASLLGTVEREDGSMQVTLDGWPLYFFSGDEAAGDTNGQGLNEVWYVVAPDGTHITDAPA